MKAAARDSAHPDDATPLLASHPAARSTRPALSTQSTLRPTPGPDEGPLQCPVRPHPSPLPRPRRRSLPLSRRRFLTGGAAVSLVAVLGNLAGGSGHLFSALASQEPGRCCPFRRPVQRFSVERPDYLLQLDITFTGFRATVIDNELRDLTPGPGSFITVQFPPQAIAEAAYSYDWDPWPVDPPPVLSVMSGPSRLVFVTPAPVVFSHPMTVADLLDWSQWTLLVPDLRAGAPLADRTCIEYPYALYLSPECVSTTAVQPGSPSSPALRHLRRTGPTAGQPCPGQRLLDRGIRAHLGRCRLRPIADDGRPWSPGPFQRCRLPPPGDRYP